MKRVVAFALLALAGCDVPRRCSQLWFDDSMWPHVNVTILSVEGRVLHLRYERMMLSDGEGMRPESYTTRTADSWRCVEGP